MPENLPILLLLILNPLDDTNTRPPHPAATQFGGIYINPDFPSTIPGMQLPYLTPDLPGVGGTIKNRPEDFFVQEIPLYEPSGEGEHVYCEIEKIGLTTFDTIDRIAGALSVSGRD